MATNNTVKIYSNDGSTLLFTSSGTVPITDVQTVTETGVTLSNGEVYTYEGNKKFLGIAWDVNKTTPNYPAGATFNYGTPVYIVEEEKEPKVTITYNENVIASLGAGQTATLQCTGKKMIDNIIVTAPEVENSPLPIEVATEEEMNSLLETAEIGDIYKYTGETGTYENGALYVVEEEDTYSLTITVTGHVGIKYNVDSPYDSATSQSINLNETKTITDIKEYVSVYTDTVFYPAPSALENCTTTVVENGSNGTITITGENASITLSTDA